MALTTVLMMPSYKREIENYKNQPEKICYVIAFDPGETTGWCAMGVPKKALEDGLMDLQYAISHINYGEIDCVGTGGWDDVAHKHAGISFGAEALGVAQMLDIMERYPDDVVIVVEDFIIDFNKIDQARHTLSPVRIMSMLSYGMYIENETPFYSRLFVQSRSMAKTTCTDKRLRSWGLYDSKGGRHSRDATRHAFYFLRTCRGSGAKASEKRWRAWPEKFSDPWQDSEDIDGSTSKPSKNKKIFKLGDRVYFD